MRIPALLPSLSLLLGVASQPVQAADPLQLTCIALLTATLALFLAPRSRLRAVTLCLSCACAGSALAEHDVRKRSADLDALFRESDSYQGLIVGRLSDRLLTDGARQRWLLLKGNRLGSTGRPVELRLRIGGQMEAPPFSPGESVRVWCRLRRPEERPGRRRIGGSIKSVALIERQPSGSSSRFAWGWRPWAERRLSRSRPDDIEARSLVQAMIFGRGEGLKETTRRSLRDAGVLHLTAVSGLHLGLVLGALIVVLRRTGLRSIYIAPLLIPISFFFAAGLGGRPSVTRAACAAALMSSGRAIGRDGSALNALTLLAGVLVAIDPAMLWDVGFQLSFAAVAGILGLAPPIVRHLRLPRPLSAAAGVSIAAYLSTLPLVTLHFSRLSPASLVTNLVATPLAASILGCGYGAVLFAEFSALSSSLAAVADLVAKLLIEVAEGVASHPGSAWPVVAPAAWHLPLWIMALFGSLSAIPAIRRCSGGLLLVLVLSVHLGSPPSTADETAVTLIDVGQGSSTLLRSADGKRMLIDAGGRAYGRFDPGERQVLPHVVANGGLQLEVLALSHGHADHASGAFALLREMAIDELWIPHGAHRHKRIVALQSAAVEAGISVRLVAPGQAIMLGELPVRIVGPAVEPLLGTNDQSLTLLAGRPPTRVLIPGDLEEAGERALLRSGEELRATLLILPHHGSRHGSAAELLDRVRPELAAVSVGRGNPFRHPHQETLERLGLRRIPLHRTDREGSLLFRSNGGRWRRDYSTK